MRPKILGLDELTANLDPESRSDLLKILSGSNSDNITLRTATHDVNFLSQLADRAYVLSKSQIIANGSLREIFSKRTSRRRKLRTPPSSSAFPSPGSKKDHID